jgi:hypothetical protein
VRGNGGCARRCSLQRPNANTHCRGVQTCNWNASRADARSSSDQHSRGACANGGNGRCGGSTAREPPAQGGDTAHRLREKPTVCCRANPACMAHP